MPRTCDVCPRATGSCCKDESPKPPRLAVADRILSGESVSFREIYELNIKMLLEYIEVCRRMAHAPDACIVAHCMHGGEDEVNYVHSQILYCLDRIKEHEDA